MNTEFAWACGLFEGEGTLGVTRNGRDKRTGRRNYAAYMKLTMTDKCVVVRFCRAIGAGKVHGPFHYKASVKPLWQWRMLGGCRAMAELLERMAPMLCARRRKQALPIKRMVKQRFG